MSRPSQPPPETVSKRAKLLLYQQVADGLRRRLSNGGFPAGARLPPLRDLARQFKVSTVTVRQALRILENQGRLQCLPGVGTFVRPHLTNSLSTHHTTVAYAAVEINDESTIEIMHAIEEACQQRGWALQIFNAQGNPQREVRNLACLTESGVSGAIILPTCDYESHEALFRLKLANFPFVLVDRSIPGLKVDLVASDHEEGAHLATSHLIEHGQQRVMMLTEPPTVPSVAARIRGYEKALSDHGLENGPGSLIRVEPENGESEAAQRPRWFQAYKAASSALKTAERPLAVFTGNAYAAWGLVMACQELGLCIPHDVAVACSDNTDIVQALRPPVTAVAHRTADIGHNAIELLERRLHADRLADPEHVLVDVDLVERESLTPPRGR